MKKIISIFSIIAFTISAYGQGLKPVKIDSLVTVSLPKDAQVTDSAGQKIFSGNGAMGYMIVIRTANHNKPLEKEKDLNKVFKDYMTQVQGQSNGSILDSRDTTVGNLKAKVFGLETRNNEGVELRNFTIIYTKEALYTFEYVYPEARKELVKDETKAFFSSISVSPELKRDDQYVKASSSAASPLGNIALFGGGGVVLLLIGYFIYRKKTEAAIS
ncbi:MAG: hypothetical protein EOP47_12435 [Sphingobacteriaceae bacterium]|nr:MAG: hypothetical protein EOP47_12435 [Sphingobacteriaceae bacterium]